jgi:hypothetical protein
MKHFGIGKVLMFLGLMLALIGCFIWIGGKIGIPFGKLPGDINIQKERYSVYFPVMTCVIISILLIIFLNLLFWFFKK